LTSTMTGFLGCRIVATSRNLTLGFDLKRSRGIR
jgi:hypothetical protein